MEKDIFKIIASYLKYWYWFIIGAVLSVALTFLYIRYQVVPQYDIYSRILLNDKEENSNSSNLESFGQMGMFKMSKNIKDEIGILTSFDLIKTTVEELDLGVGYYIEGAIREIEAYPENLPFRLVLQDSVPFTPGELGSVKLLDSNSFQLNTINSQNGLTTNKTYSFGELINSSLAHFTVVLNEEEIDFSNQKPVVIRLKSIDELTASYRSRLMVYTVERDGGLIELNLTDAIPQRGEDMLEKHIEIYARKSAENKNMLAKNTIALIDERLELLVNELNSVEQSVESYKQNNQLTDVNSEASRFANLADATDTELANLRTQISALNSLETSLSQSSSQSFNPITAFNIQSQSINGAISTYNTEIQRRSSIISASGTGNPILPEIDRKLLETKNLIIENIRSIKGQLVRSQRDLINKSTEYRSKISKVPEAERALLEINRDQGLNQSLYLYLLQKKEEEALSLSAPFSDTRIVEEPKALPFPSNPKKTPMYLGAFLLGVFVPFLWLFIKELMNTKIQTVKDIEALTKATVLGSIASSKNKLMLSQSDTSPSAELFRLLRHNLNFVSQGKPKQVIMVTSGDQGEGKTYVSTNLALSLAITEKKVVLLGFDLRVPRLLQEMNIPEHIGITDYIIKNELNLNDIIIQSTHEKNLSIIGSGPIPPNPGELMLNNRIKSLIHKLQEQYDYVIIDTAPIGKVADAFALTPYVDTTLFVVRQNKTQKADIDFINEIVTSKKLTSLMVVLNDVKIDKNNGYSYGYGNDNKKRSR